MTEYLTIAIEQEKRPVTYKLLARAQGMHVNAAKQALWEFLQTSQSARAVYCISGKLANDDDDRYTIRLVKDNELEDAKKSFRTITGLHVYSLLPNDPKDLSVLVAASKDIPRLQLPDRIKCGVIKSTALEQQAGKQAGAPAIAKNPSGSSTTRIPASTTPSVASKKTSPFSNSSKPSTLGKRDRDPPVSKPKHVLEPVPNPPKSVNREAQKALASSIFFDDDEDNQMKDVDSTSLSDAHAAVEEEEQPREDMMELDEPEHTPEVDETAPPAAGPRKAFRKVDKQKEYSDDRGYTITENYSSWEEQDAPAPALKPSPAPTPPGREKATPKTVPKAKPGTKKKPEQQQQMLTSWFTKK